MSSGERIRKCRKSAGLTQKQLAEAVGLTEGAIRNYELGLRTPKEAVLKSIAAELEVSVVTLEDIGVTTARDVLEVIFRMEETLGLVPIEAGGQLCVGIDRHAQSAPKTVMALKAWKSMRDDLAEGKVTQAQYDEWKNTFER